VISNLAPTQGQITATWTLKADKEFRGQLVVKFYHRVNYTQEGVRASERRVRFYPFCLIGCILTKRGCGTELYRLFMTNTA
jgi:hypothetical protein